MSPSERTGGVQWLSWGHDAFLRARAEGKPVLLSIVTPWSVGCREMDDVCFADAATAALINERVIPVRVDADQRPDIAERYDLGGVPTTAFLTPEGGLLGGGTFVPPQRLRDAVIRVAAIAPPADRRSAGEGAGAWREAEGAVRTDADLIDLVFGTFDHEHGGFGGAPRFPHVAPIWLAVDLHLEGWSRRSREGVQAAKAAADPAWLDIAARTLDAMGWGPLYDEQEGGFFRCASRADWNGAAPEKLLSTNAALLDLYLYAGMMLGNDRWLARASDILGYINRAMTAANGAWRASPCADGSRQFSDANASTASAVLHAAAAFQDDALGSRALEVLERVLLSSYKPGDGVAHSAAGMRGLLSDQIAMARANLDAWEATGNVVYRMMAEELVHYALRTMWDERLGGFFDCATDLGAESPVALMPLKPFVVNCDAAVVLRRIAAATGDAGFDLRARRVLEAIAPRAAAFGPLAAHYLLARRAVLR
jgi:hypothetical protein